MAYASFLSLIDWGIKGRIFTEVQSILGLTSLSNDSAFFPKDVALRHISEKRGRDVVEFFNLWRGPAEPDWKRQRTSVARRGIYTNFTDATETYARNYKAMPATLKYDVWFWTTSLDKKHLLEEWYLFWQQSDPNLDITYNDLYPLELDLHFGSMVDEGTVDVEFTKGRYHILRVPLIVDGWIFKTPADIAVVNKFVVAIYDDNVQSTALDWVEYNGEDALTPDELTEYAWYLSPTWSNVTATVVGDVDCLNAKALELIARRDPVDGRYFTNTAAPYPTELQSWMHASDNVWGYIVKVRAKVISGGEDGAFLIALEDSKFRPTVKVYSDKITLLWDALESPEEYEVDMTDDYHVVEVNGVNDMIEVSLDGVEVIRKTMVRPQTSVNPQLSFGPVADMTMTVVRYDYVKYICKKGMFYREEVESSSL